ncbi:MAG: tyrosine-type recombinase/integrase [Terriglobales bacterium]
MLAKFQEFIRERQYLHNVTPATIQWHTHNLKWLKTELPTDAELKDAVMRMRQKGLKATGANSAIRSINAYLKWVGSPHHIQQMKEPQLILPTFSGPQVRLLVNWKPKGFYERRLHLMILMLLDTGARISEVLGVRVEDCDLDNLLIILDGKGRKQRRVPFSFELRKQLFRYAREFELQPHALAIGTRTHCVLGRRDCLRDVKNLCRKLSFSPPARTLHAFRHTFALNYLRKGGSVFHLQKVLGHSSLEMTRRYANLMTEDLQAIHQQVSLLGP